MVAQPKALSSRKLLLSQYTKKLSTLLQRLLLKHLQHLQHLQLQPLLLLKLSKPKASKPDSRRVRDLLM